MVKKRDLSKLILGEQSGRVIQIGHPTLIIGFYLGCLGRVPV